jgi:splicing factor 3B subunit 4
MPGNPLSTLFIGNLDDRVDERVLYEVMIQAGPLVDLYIPRDKETNRHKGYAFAEYETEEVAQYAIKLFSGLVCLHNKFVRFAVCLLLAISFADLFIVISFPLPCLLDIAHYLQYSEI